MEILFLLTIFSGISIAMCLFTVIYLRVGIKEKSLKKTFLILLIVAISLRIIKSIFFYIMVSKSSFMPALGIAIGFLGFSSFGPLTYWCFKFNAIRKFQKTEYLHLIFPIIGTVLIIVLGKFYNTFYLACSLSLIIYLIYIFFVFFYKKDKLIKNTFKLDKAIFITMALLFFVFLIQYFTPTIQWYVIGTGLSSLIITGLFIYMLKHPPILMKAIHKTKPKPSQIDTIIKALEIEKIYHKQGISLTEFSILIDIPKYIISVVIKDRYQKSFPEVINHMRIEDIMTKLKDPDSVNIKVEELAFDVGFNSPSSFYNAFKKETSMTPREFQKNTILNN
nr:helix-turn-helix domain-containing protein [uncultured Psychroserpens sp.]